MSAGASAITASAAFVAGVVSFASPCFLPVVPVFVGYMAGQDAAGHEDARGGQKLATKRFTAVANALAFVAAFSLIFILLWALVGVIGWVVGDFRDILRIGGGIVLVILGLHTAGLLKIPFLERTLRPGYNPAMQEAPTIRRSALLGLAFGAGWMPCITPVLGGILGLATASDSAGAGVGLLLVYSLGLGVPFVVASAGITGLTRQLSWFSRHATAVSIVTGVMLIVVGFLMINNLYSRLVPTAW